MFPFLLNLINTPSVSVTASVLCRCLICRGVIAAYTFKKNVLQFELSAAPQLNISTTTGTDAFFAIPSFIHPPPVLRIIKKGHSDGIITAINLLLQTTDQGGEMEVSLTNGE